MQKGCFGSVICVNSRNEACRKCTLFSDCFKAAKANLSKITGQSTVDTSKHERRQFQQEVETAGATYTTTIIESTKRERLTAHQRAIVDNPEFPAKARKLMGSIFRKGITDRYLINLLRAGVNPFKNSTPKILQIACDLILTDSLTKRGLISAFIAAGQSRNTARSQADSVITALMLMGVLNSTLKLRE